MKQPMYSGALAPAATRVRALWKANLAGRTQDQILAPCYVTGMLFVPSQWLLPQAPGPYRSEGRYNLAHRTDW